VHLEPFGAFGRLGRRTAHLPLPRKQEKEEEKKLENAAPQQVASLFFFDFPEESRCTSSLAQSTRSSLRKEGVPQESQETQKKAKKKKKGKKERKKGKKKTLQRCNSRTYNSFETLADPDFNNNS
jgi:hypothetical protein